MQMVVVLAAGHVLANSPLFKKYYRGLPLKLKPLPWQLLSSPLCHLLPAGSTGDLISNWSAFAKEIARQVRKVDYRLLIASAYSGFVVWHGD